MCLKSKMIHIGLKDARHLTAFGQSEILIKRSTAISLLPSIPQTSEILFNILSWVLFSEIWVSHYLPHTIPV